jgi:hypothetical protein
LLGTHGGEPAFAALLCFRVLPGFAAGVLFAAAAGRAGFAGVALAAVFFCVIARFFVLLRVGAEGTPNFLSIHKGLPPVKLLFVLSLSFAALKASPGVFMVLGSVVSFRVLL